MTSQKRIFGLAQPNDKRPDRVTLTPTLSEGIRGRLKPPAIPYTPAMSREDCPDLSLDLKSDPWVTRGLFEMSRMCMDNFDNLGEFVAGLTSVFEHVRRCTVLFSPSNIFSDVPTRLEHRLTVINDGTKLTIDESGRSSSSGTFDPALSVFINRSPTVFDYNPGFGMDYGIQIVFDDLNRSSDRGIVRRIQRYRDGGMVAIMPFYYREPDNPSGVVWLEGDLRAKNSRLAGFSRAFWTATLAMSASSQISQQLIHRFDSTTNLPRRLDFELDLKEGIRDVISEGKNLYLMFIDLDNFKSINDVFTHPIGDEILRQAAEMMQRSVRTGDIVARVGGEEFAVKVECDSNEIALEIAERIRKNIESIRVWVRRSGNRVEIVKKDILEVGPRPPGVEEVMVTCSIGITDVRLAAGPRIGGPLPENGRGDKVVQEIFSEVYGRSTEMLHSAKRSGKNCIFYDHGGSERRISSMPPPS